MTLQNLLDEAKHLSVTDKWQLVRQLLDDLEAEKKAAAHEDWGTFVNRMYGALADDPIERLPQLPLTERDPID